MGADVFPKLLIAVILILSIYELIKYFTSEKQSNENSPSRDWQEKVNPILVFGFCVVYVILIKIIGFFTATTGFVVLTMWYLGVRKVITYIISVIGINLFIYLAFVMQLSVPLPKGLLF